MTPAFSFFLDQFFVFFLSRVGAIEASIQLMINSVVATELVTHEQPFILKTNCASGKELVEEANRQHIFQVYVMYCLQKLRKKLVEFMCM